MAKLERYVRTSFKPEHFLTLFLGQVDLTSGMLTYCNAGHMPPLVCSRDGQTAELTGSDPALNVAPCRKFKLFQRSLKEGDLVLIYTDGLVEQENEHGEDYGLERVISVAHAHREQRLEDIGRSILKSQRAFGAHQRQQDDTTLILLRREEGGEGVLLEQESPQAEDVRITVEGEPTE
jgi:sigma-B regulation protein RsbU (phosphoserine phosphatase)